MNKIASGLCALSLVAAAGCNDEVDTGITGLGDDAVMDPAMMADDGAPTTPDDQDPGGDAVETPDEPAGPEDLAGVAAFAVQLSDYVSAGVAIVDGEGSMMSELFVHSGSEVPGLSAALHGDIALPSTACDPSLLTVIARMGGDYILQVDLASGEVVRQLKTHGTSGADSYLSNPQDMLCLGDGRALVTRLAPNLDPEADDIDLGDDVLVVDLDNGERIDRVALNIFEGTTTAMDWDTGETFEEDTYARPGNIVRVGDQAVVGMSMQSLGFNGGEGAVGILSLDDLTIARFDLDGMANCGNVMPVAGRDDAVLVSCNGAPWGDAATAGIAMLSLDGGAVTVEHTFQAEAGSPISTFSVVSVGGSRVVAVASGDYVENTPDTLYEVDLATGSARELFMSAGAGEIGAGSFRAETSMLVVPDASHGLRVFDAAGEVMEEIGSVEMDAALPARSIRPLIAM